MPTVTFLPMKKTVECKVGETLLDVSLEHDIHMQHACGGFCACTTCEVRVISGADHLSPMEEEEEERIDRMGVVERAGVPSRLGCQSKITGDVTVEVVNID